MTRSPPWTDPENGACVALYFVMLDAAIPGHAYTKAGLIRVAQGTQDATPFSESFAGKLSARSKQSIEFKLMNASAAHAALDPHADTMDCFGYRAMPNYQAALKDTMRSVIELREINTSDISATGGHYAG